MNTLLSQQETAEVAGEYFSRLATVIQLAFQDYLAALKEINSLGIRTNLKARTSASLIHDFIQIRTRDEFINEGNIKVDEFNGMFAILISGRVFIRFKKLKPDLNTSNVKTEQVNLFNKQQLELPGLNRLTLLTAGYVPDITWTSIQNIFLTCKRGDEIIWHRDLHSEAIQVSIFGVAEPNNRQASEGDEPIVRIKQNKDLEKKLTGNG